MVIDHLRFHAASCALGIKVEHRAQATRLEDCMHNSLWCNEVSSAPATRSLTDLSNSDLRFQCLHNSCPNMDMEDNAVLPGKASRGHSAQAVLWTHEDWTQQIHVTLRVFSGTPDSRANLPRGLGCCNPKHGDYRIYAQSLDTKREGTGIRHPRYQTRQIAYRFGWCRLKNPWSVACSTY